MEPRYVIACVPMKWSLDDLVEIHAMHGFIHFFYGGDFLYTVRGEDDANYAGRHYILEIHYAICSSKPKKYIMFEQGHIEMQDELRESDYSKYPIRIVPTPNHPIHTLVLEAITRNEHRISTTNI